MVYEVYKIQNKINNKFYIGISTIGWKNRVRKHLSESRNGGDFKLHSAIRKYGEANFSFDLLETCISEEELKEREKYWISILKTQDDNFGYNMTAGGDGTFGRLHSDETKSKISERALKCESTRHVKIEAISDKETYLFKSITEAAIFFNVERNWMNNSFQKRDTLYVNKEEQVFALSRRHDLKPDPKPKKTKRDPEQVRLHMEKIVKMSAEARKLNKNYKEKSKLTNLLNGKTKIIQQFKDGVLIAEYNGSRDVIAKNEGYSRSGVQHSLKGRTSNYQGFIWKYKN